MEQNNKIVNLIKELVTNLSSFDFSDIHSNYVYFVFNYRSTLYKSIAKEIFRFYNHYYDFMNIERYHTCINDFLKNTHVYSQFSNDKRFLFEKYSEQEVVDNLFNSMTYNSPYIDFEQFYKILVHFIRYMFDSSYYKLNIFGRFVEADSFSKLSELELILYYNNFYYYVVYYVNNEVKQIHREYNMDLRSFNFPKAEWVRWLNRKYRILNNYLRYNNMDMPSLLTWFRTESELSVNYQEFFYITTNVAYFMLEIELRNRHLSYVRTFPNFCIDFHLFNDHELIHFSQYLKPAMLNLSRELFLHIDVDCSGTLELPEFLEYWQNKYGQRDRLILKEKFKDIDLDGNGVIDYFEFETYLVPVFMDTLKVEMYRRKLMHFITIKEDLTYYVGREREKEIIVLVTRLIRHRNRIAVKQVNDTKKTTADDYKSSKNNNTSFQCFNKGRSNTTVKMVRCETSPNLGKNKKKGLTKNESFINVNTEGNLNQSIFAINRDDNSKLEKKIAKYDINRNKTNQNWQVNYKKLEKGKKEKFIIEGEETSVVGISMKLERDKLHQNRVKNIVNKITKEEYYHVLN